MVEHDVCLMNLIKKIITVVPLYLYYNFWNDNKYLIPIIKLYQSHDHEFNFKEQHVTCAKC